MTDLSQESNASAPLFKKRRKLLFGKNSDSIIKVFFGSHAMVALVVLALITIFLFKEGAGFIGLYHKSMREYRLSGLEYVALLKEQREGYVKLNQYLDDLKARWIEDIQRKGYSQNEIAARISSPEANALFADYPEAGSELYAFLKKKMHAAIKLRDDYLTSLDLEQTRAQFAAQIERVEDLDYALDTQDRTKFIRLLEQSNQTETLQRVSSGTVPEAADRELYLSLLREEYKAFAANVQPVDFAQSIHQVTSGQERYAELLNELERSINQLLANAESIQFEDPALAERLNTFKSLNTIYFSEFSNYKETLANWDSAKPVSIWYSMGAFLTGKKWVTASDQQDWYGLLPLLSGSLLIASIALCLAVPLGVGAAIYVNQIAGPTERNLIKPYIEFISAIPSVVIGFFGVVVFGEALRQLSQMELLQWLPFFPLQERLNAFTAGCLLALMAVPTIFTLAEDAINNIPANFTEASLAMGASKLQTTFRIIVPSALSGIISAIMLGFGRVIGETMVVLLCAGNRIKIPDFTQGPGVVFEPVHTMTGIIAQEMGEVARGTLHYRALFMIGIVLFFISLLVNYGAQWVVKKYNKLDY